YMAGYLSRYDFTAYEFNEKNEPVHKTETVSLNAYKSLVLKGSVKVSGYFYRKNNTFSFLQSFALIPIVERDRSVGTLVLDLKSKRVDENGSFPELLVDGKIKNDASLRNYSYAYYNDSLLLSQHGSYVYDVVNKKFKGELKRFVFEDRTENAKR